MNPDNNAIFINNIPQLRWACRRGMLELDVLLGNFLEEAFPELAIDDKKRFVALLTCSDPELFSWLLGREVPNNAELAHIINKIRHHARTRV